ncbi:MAG: hypothetical protein J2O47_02945 [Acidimicrobiaceae bacterium]|nr:hypothetical protein [Acidimicrobiaceae bacterium]
MAKTTIRYNLEAFEEIRRLPKVDSLLGDATRAVKAGLAAGEYASGVEAGRTRSRGFVVTADAEAIIDNSRNQSLLRAANGTRVS